MKYKLTFAYCFVVLLLSVLPIRSFPKVEVSNIDKIVHFLLYFALAGAMFFDNLLENGKKIISTKKLACFFIFSTFFGVFVEIIQFFLPFRSAEWYDLLADLLGAMFGIVIVWGINVLFYVKKI